MRVPVNVEQKFDNNWTSIYNLKLPDTLRIVGGFLIL